MLLNRSNICAETMKFSVLLSTIKLQILNSIIKLVPVNMVNNLSSSKLSPNMFFHNLSVFKNTPNNHPITGFIKRRVSKYLISTRILSSPFPVGVVLPHFVFTKKCPATFYRAESFDTPILKGIRFLLIEHPSTFFTNLIHSLNIHYIQGDVNRFLRRTNVK